MDFGKKKKKKKKVAFGEGGDAAGPEGGLAGEAGGDAVVAAGPAWAGSDRDYTYSELLQRAFEFQHGGGKGGGGGGAAGGSRTKIRLRPPEVAREGSKKTVFINFGATCASIHRQPDHVLSYFATELGTTGNVQEGGGVVFKGKFVSSDIEKVLKRYIQEYVLCQSCKGPDTVLMRDANTRLYFLQCESCGATRSVAPIKQGFMAQVGRRKKN